MVKSKKLATIKDVKPKKRRTSWQADFGDAVWVALRKNPQATCTDIARILKIDKPAIQRLGSTPASFCRFVERVRTKVLAMKKGPEQETPKALRNIKVKEVKEELYYKDTGFPHLRLVCE